MKRRAAGGIDTGGTEAETEKGGGDIPPVPHQVVQTPMPLNIEIAKGQRRVWKWIGWQK